MTEGPLTKNQTQRYLHIVSQVATSRSTAPGPSLLDYESSIESSAAYCLLTGAIDQAVDHAWTAEGLRRVREAGYRQTLAQVQADQAAR